MSAAPPRTVQAK